MPSLAGWHSERTCLDERRTPGMETRDQDVKPETREHCLRVTQLQRWGTIQEYVDLCVRREAHW